MVMTAEYQARFTKSLISQLRTVIIRHIIPQKNDEMMHYSFMHVLERYIKCISA